MRGATFRVTSLGVISIHLKLLFLTGNGSFFFFFFFFLLSPAFSKKSGGTLFSAFHGAWRVVQNF